MLLFPFQAPLSTRWFKLQGQFSSRVYEDRGVLIIANSQVDDSGIYVCQGQDGVSTVEERIAINIGGNLYLKAELYCILILTFLQFNLTSLCQGTYR